MRHHAELDLAREIEWRREDERDDRRDLAESLRKGGDPHASIDEREKVSDERAEAPSDHVLLGIFPAQKRDLLGIFAQAGEREAEVGFHVLALKVQADQRPSDQMGDQRARGRVDQRHPEQEARQDEVGAGQRE